MIPLPPSNTPRFRIHYDQLTLQHSFQIRSLESPTSIGTMIGDFLTSLAAQIMPLTISMVDWAPAGSDIFNPVVTGKEGVTYGTAVVLDAPKAYSLGFLGRTSGGRRVRLFVFGVNTLATNYRF